MNLPLPEVSEELWAILLASCTRKLLDTLWVGSQPRRQPKDYVYMWCAPYPSSLLIGQLDGVFAGVVRCFCLGQAPTSGNLWLSHSEWQMLKVHHAIVVECRIRGGSGRSEYDSVLGRMRG